MKTLRTLAVLFAGPFVAAAILAPIVFSLGGQVLDPFPWRFSQVFSRTAMISTIGFVLLLRKDLDLTSLRNRFALPEEGFTPVVRRLAIGALFSLGSAALFFPLILFYGDLVLNDRTVATLLLKFAKIFPVAFLIGLIEESFFRGILFFRLQRSLSVTKAALISSCLYAVVHFISPSKSFAPTEFSFTSGFSFLVVCLERMWNPEVLPAFIGLTLVGLTLCYAIQRSGSMALIIGLHAGWVIAVKMSAALTVTAPGVVFSSPIGSRYYLVSTSLGWLSVFVVWAAIFMVSNSSFIRRGPLGAAS